MDKRRICIECHTGSAEYMYYPCNHVCACYECVKRNRHKLKCLYCGSYSNKVIKPNYVISFI